jgi:iron complex transport system ATP-binding protein
MLEIQKLWLNYGEQKILEDINLYIPENTVVGLIGPNGSGKSSLLKILAGLQEPTHGDVIWKHQNLNRLSLRQRAQQVALLIQDGSLEHDLSVREYVLLGRLPYRNLWQAFTPSDLQKLNTLLDQLNLLNLAERACGQLSGGEKQRVLLARCLMQETSLILLDEPTNHLDLKYQIQILDLLMQFQKQNSKTLVIVFHDLLLAKHYCSHVVLLKDKTVLKFGRTVDVLTRPNIEKLFDMESSVYLNDLLKPE